MEGSNLPKTQAVSPIPGDSTSSHAGSEATTNTPVGESPSQVGNNLPSSQVGAPLPSGEGSNLVASQATQAGRQLPSLPSVEGSNLPTTQAVSPIPGDSTSSHAGNEATTNTPVGESPSQAGNNLPASQAGRSGRHNPKCSARQRALQASQGNSTASQADSTGSWEVNPTPNPPNRLPQGSCPEDPNQKCIINLSSKPLTPPQRSVLAKGPNFVVSPKQPPNLEYITVIEAACTKLSQQDAEELRAEVNRVIRSSHPPKPT